MTLEDTTIDENTTDDSLLENGISVPSELQQKLPRRIRLAGRGIYYLVGSAAVSALLCAFIVASLSKTAKEVSNGRELARDGRKAYTGDLRAGGLIITALKQVEAGRTAEDVAREYGVRKHTIYAWKAKFGDGGQRGAEGLGGPHLKSGCPIFATVVLSLRSAIV